MGTRCNSLYTPRGTFFSDRFCPQSDLQIVPALPANSAVRTSDTHAVFCAHCTQRNHHALQWGAVWPWCTWGLALAMDW